MNLDEAWLRRRARQRGSAMVESALVLLAFMLLLLGILEFGRAVWVYNTINYAARAGARYASVHGTAAPATDDDIRAVVAANTAGIATGALSVSATWSPDRQRGSSVIVQVTYPFDFVVPLSGQASMQLAGRASGVVAY